MNIFKMLYSKKAFLLLSILGMSAGAAKKPFTDVEIPFQDSSGVQSVIRIPKTLLELFSKKTLQDVSPDYMDTPTMTQFVQKIFPEKEELDMLEIGPGRCKKALDLLKSDSRSISWDGVDCQFSGQKTLDDLKEAAKGEVRFFQQDALDFVPDKNYDFIFTEYAPFNIAACLKLVKRLAPSLKKGGVFCFFNAFDNYTLDNFYSETQDYQLNEKKSFSLSGKVPTYFDPLKEFVEKETGLTLETLQYMHDEPKIRNPVSHSFSKISRKQIWRLWYDFLYTPGSYLKDIEALYSLPLKYCLLAQEYDLLKKEQRHRDEDWRLKMKQLSEPLIEFKGRADLFKCAERCVKERLDKDRWNKGDCQERKKIASKYDDSDWAANVSSKVVVLRKE